MSVVVVAVARVRALPLGLRFMAYGALAFSVMTASVKFAGQSLPLFQVLAIRSLVVTALSGWAVARTGAGFRPRDPWRLLQRAVFGFATLCCYLYSVIHLPLADATVIYFLHPVLTALAAAVVLGEGMQLREVGLAGVSALGVLLVARPGFLFGGEGSLDPFAAWIGVVGAFMSAGSWVTIRTIRRDSPELVVFYFAALTVLLSTPPMLLDFAPISRSAWVAILIAGGATHLAQLWFTRGLMLEPAGRATAVSYVQILFAAAWGWFLFGDLPDPWTWMGAALISGSTLLLMRVRTRL